MCDYFVNDNVKTSWCSKQKLCLKDLNTNSIYYNTPLTIYEDIRTYPDKFPENMLNFVYLDYSINSDSLIRIVKNLDRLPKKCRKKVILMTNADVFGIGLYLLRVRNCSVGQIAKVVAKIIKAHVHKGRVVSVKEMLEISCGKSIPENSMDDFDVHSILETINQCQLIDDCSVCRNTV